MKMIVREMERHGKCRFCDAKLKKGDEVVTMDRIYISPRSYDLNFHKECWSQMVKDAEQYKIMEKLKKL